MTTLATLVAVGILERIEPFLEADEQPFRRLYCDPAFVSWLDHTLPTIPKDWSDVDCHVQVETAFTEFVDGTPPYSGRDLVPSIRPIDHPFRGGLGDEDRRYQDLWLVCGVRRFCDRAR